MPFSLTVIYDDRLSPSAEIAEIIGAARYSGILRRRLSLGKEVRREVAQGGGEDFFHLIDDRDAHFLTGLIEASPANRIFLRLPSCLMPTRPGILAGLVAQARYALGPTLLAPPVDGEAAALLPASEVLPLMQACHPAAIREHVLALASSVTVLPDPCGFVDLRRTESFLAFMGGATEPRLFNATSTDRWVLRKSSTDRRKMEAEYRFFHLAPEVLKPFFLPTYDFVDHGERASYAMERLAIPDVALQFIHHAFDESSFVTLIERFFDFLAARPGRPDGVAAVREMARQVILGKMEERLGRFLETDAGRRLDAILAASGPCGGLGEMAVRSRRVIESAISQDPSDRLVIGHGDACFSNILFDRRTGLMRLIDPRGALTLDQAWLHPLYDLAKFSHSVLGGYDFVNNDLFDCLLDAGLRLQISFDDGGSPAWCRELFLSRLDAHGLSRFVLRAYELSLFLSMLPLHVDHPRKLAGFSLIAAGLLLELEGP